MQSLVVLVMCACLVNSLPPPHPDVLAVRQEEELLHPLQRSPVLRNPNLLQILPLSSLLHEGETLVYERDAHDVSRQQIYNVLTHAGFIPRRAYPPSSKPMGYNHNQVPVAFPEEPISFHEASHFSTHDALQYL